MCVEKVAIVTGSATGIGRAVALQLARARFNVVVNYHRSRTEASETAAEIDRAGASCMVVEADVSCDADCRRLVAEVESTWGRLDLLVNNAGATTAVPFAEFDRVTEDDWDRTFAVNVKGAFFMARACASLLRKSRGCIVNVSSTAALNSIGSSIAYAASKAALNNLTVALARVFAPEVRVNAVMPGFVETRWNERTLGKRLGALRDVLKRQTLLGGVTQPDQVAELVCSMVLGMSRVTGELIVIDGGWLVGR